MFIIQKSIHCKCYGKTDGNGLYYLDELKEGFPCLVIFELDPKISKKIDQGFRPGHMS
jgi:hypothetical protein